MQGGSRRSVLGGSIAIQWRLPSASSAFRARVTSLEDAREFGEVLTRDSGETTTPAMHSLVRLDVCREFRGRCVGRTQRSDPDGGVPRRDPRPGLWLPVQGPVSSSAPVEFDGVGGHDHIDRPAAPEPGDVETHPNRVRAGGTKHRPEDGVRADRELLTDRYEVGFDSRGERRHGRHRVTPNPKLRRSTDTRYRSCLTS